MDFDWKVDADFFWKGLWPIALIDEIGRHKDELFKALARNTLEPDMLITQATYTVEGHEYLVICGSDPQNTREKLLRVVQVRLVG